MLLCNKHEQLAVFLPEDALVAILPPHNHFHSNSKGIIIFLFLLCYIIYYICNRIDYIIIHLLYTLHPVNYHIRYSPVLKVLTVLWENQFICMYMYIYMHIYN